MSFVVVVVVFLLLFVEVDGMDCVVYVIDYVNFYIGNGDMIGDVVLGGIVGVVVGCEWDLVNGEICGVRVGGVLGVFDNFGFFFGGW